MTKQKSIMNINDIVLIFSQEFDKMKVIEYIYFLSNVFFFICD